MTKIVDVAALDRAKAAYVELLRMPHGSLRAALQPVLAGLRDAIALEMGHPAEVVQDTFEARAADAGDLMR